MINNNKAACLKSGSRPLLSYDHLVSSGFPIEQHNRPELSAEEIAGDVIALDRLRSALKELSEAEMELVKGLYYQERSERGKSSVSSRNIH